MGITNKIKILFFIFPLFIYTQENSDDKSNLKVVDTLMHKVERKQTLYSISNIYKISIDDIKKYNPLTNHLKSIEKPISTSLLRASYLDRCSSQCRKIRCRLEMNCGFENA